MLFKAILRHLPYEAFRRFDISPYDADYAHLFSPQAHKSLSFYAVEYFVIFAISRHAYAYMLCHVAASLRLRRCLISRGDAPTSL